MKTWGFVRHGQFADYSSSKFNDCTRDVNRVGAAAVSPRSGEQVSSETGEKKAPSRNERAPTN